MRTGRTREWRLWDYIELYRRNGIAVLPGRPGEKHPSLKGYEEYWERPPTDGEIEEWFKGREIGEVNVFVVTGPVSGGLVVLDFDGEAVYREFKRRLGELDEVTFYAVMGSWIVRTSRGYHVYLRVEDLEEIVEKYGGKHKLEAVLETGEGPEKAEVFMGREITAPPSLHPSGGRYRFYSPQLEDEVLVGERGIVTLMGEQFETVLEALGIKQLGEKQGGGSVGGAPVRVPGEWRRLSENEKQDLLNLLLPVFRRMDGRRHSFVPSLAGYCAKKGVHPEDCAGIVARLYDAIGRRDREHLPAVRRTYERYVSGEPVAAVEAPAGDVVRGLRPELRDVLGEGEAERFLRELEQLLAHGSGDAWEASRLDEVYANPLYNRFNWRSISEGLKQKLVELLGEPWRKAVDNDDKLDFIASLAGLCAKSRVRIEDCVDIVNRLYSVLGDNGAEGGMYSVIIRTYERYVEGKPVAAVEGGGGRISGLRPLFKKLLGTVRGEIQLLQLLRLLPGGDDTPGFGRIAWLERDVETGETRRWIVATGNGIVIRRTGRNGTVETLLSTAVIDRVERVRIIGLNKPAVLYKVYLNNGDVFIGTVEEIARRIKPQYGLGENHGVALARLFESMSYEYGASELYYSPGPWIVGDRIVLARETGYLPDWKPNITWRPVEDGDTRTGLELVKRNVEAYGDPRIPSLVLSYGIISWAAHWFKQEFSIFPQMIIYGRQGRGKTYILQLLKIVMNQWWDDNPPATDYQARRELSKSTIPYILQEANDFFEKITGDRPDKDALAGYNMLVRAATEMEMREAGGDRYGGTYLAVRAFIGATNTIPESRIAKQPDKVLLVRFEPSAQLDVRKVRGINPTYIRGTQRLKKAVASILPEALKIFEEMIPSIKQRLHGMSREDLVNEYIRIGYEVWRRLYEKYGLEPFPEPAEVSMDYQVETLENQYREAFDSYISRLRHKYSYNSEYTGEIRDPPFMVVSSGVEGETLAIQALDHHMGVIYDGELIVKSGFISEFKTWMAKQLGITAPDSVDILAEILGFRKTTKTFPETGIRKTNVFIRPYIP